MAEKEPDAQVQHQSLYAALAAAQAEIKNPDKTKDGKVKGTSKASGKDYEYTFKYADIGDVLEAILPIFSRHGLCVTQPTKIVDGSMILVTRIAHTSGETLESEYPVCSLNGNHQSMGAALTYARRYALTSLAGVAAVDDTDGEGAADVGEGPRVKMSANQAKSELNWPEIQAAIDTAKDFATLDKQAERIEQRKGFWPDTYYHKARERVLFNRLEMAGARMANAKTLDDLNDAFADLEGILDKKVPWDDLAGLHRKYEAKLEGAFPGDPLTTIQNEFPGARVVDERSMETAQ